MDKLGHLTPSEKLEQTYKAVRTIPPTNEELEISEKLDSYMNKNFPLESEENITRRSLILADLRKIFRNWFKQVCLDKGIPEEIASEAGGNIYISGSYRLGVNEPGADIDTICVAPQHVTREDFFSTLKAIFLKHPKVTNLVAIEGAIVPLITFDYEDINIDLQIAILPVNTVPENLNILDDRILLGVDQATEKSLNGPRVTELMIKLTPNRDSFIRVLRIVRRWAKRRGLYSNKMGYLGGINWCILVCFINQLYPTASPSVLLTKFFMVLSNWKWPLAIQLCNTYDAKLGLDVWNASVGSNRYHVMPILTPAYPSMNSSVNVSNLSLSVMMEEFKRGLQIVQETITEHPENWDKLFEFSDFFAIQQHYLAVDIHATNEEDQQAWCGFCESRLRKLVDSLAYLPPLRRIRAFPKKFELSFLDNKDAFGVCFFVAFDIDRSKIHGNELHINSSVDYFKQNDLYRWPKRTSGMDVKITHVAWKNLPEIVFEDIGGRTNARTIRREYMKKKKELEAANTTTSTDSPQGKRKRSEDETDNGKEDDNVSKHAKLDEQEISNENGSPATTSTSTTKSMDDIPSSTSTVESPNVHNPKGNYSVNGINKTNSNTTQIRTKTLTAPSSGKRTSTLKPKMKIKFGKK